jgi:cytochrome c
MKQVVVAAVVLVTATLTANAAGDPAAGEKVFNKCKICHNVGEGAKTKIGPELNGIVGRKQASIEGFSYSQGLKDMSAKGGVWTEEELTKYLHDPKAYNPTTKMAFAGLPKDQDIADVIAYLGQFDADGKKK